MGNENETKRTAIGHASAMPAPTWHFLKMNDTTIEIPAGLALSPDVKVSEPWSAKGADDEFENALADAQAAWELSHPAPTADELAARAEFMAAEADATYGGTAQSAYQARADALEDARSLAAAFEHGTGGETAAFLRHAAGRRIVIASRPGHSVDARVVVTAVPEAVSAAAIDVVADTGSDVRLSIVVASPSEGAGEPEPERLSHPGITGTTVRVFADDGAQVRIVRTQALGGGCTDIDDTGLFVAADAHVDVRQTVLGAANAFTGLAGDLRGERARVDVDTRYLGQDDQVRDFNYSLRHHGPKSKCDLRANGVLAGRSSKTLRGTIDLVRGCKGAEGSENETVLLVDDDVRNKTVPVILCNEDDVAGNHGATIGHIRDEQLFYLASRGLSQEVAERMFVGALVEQAVNDAPDDEARGAVAAFARRMALDFEEDR